MGDSLDPPPRFLPRGGGPMRAVVDFAGGLDRWA